MEEARKNKFTTNWSEEKIDVPEFSGVRVFDDYPLEEIVNYIDWTPFFLAWELKGSHPKILDDKKWGEKARELYSGAAK